MSGFYSSFSLVQYVPPRRWAAACGGTPRRNTRWYLGRLLGADLRESFASRAGPQGSALWIGWAAVGSGDSNACFVKQRRVCRSRERERIQDACDASGSPDRPIARERLTEFWTGRLFIAGPFVFFCTRSRSTTTGRYSLAW